jgi:hypothetical protein
MNADKLAHSPSGGSAGIGGRLNGADIATDEDGHIARADILLTDQLNICGFDHCVGGFHRTDESLGLDHSQCFERHYGVPLFFLVKIKNLGRDQPNTLTYHPPTEDSRDAQPFA